MTTDNLRPWRLTWLWDLVLVVAFVFAVAAAGALVATLSTLKAHLLTKVFMVVGAFSGVAFVCALAMWNRYWRRVGWDVSCWTFSFGPEPEYEDARLAWRWGRRLHFFWFLIMACVFAVPTIEAIARR